MAYGREQDYIVLASILMPSTCFIACLLFAWTHPYKSKLTW